MEKIAAVLTLLILSAGAQAVPITFSVTDIGFSNVLGDDEDLKWSLLAARDKSFDLDEGEARTFVYGRLRTEDFGIGGSDAGDNNDRFTVNLNVSGPDSGVGVSRVGRPGAERQQGGSMNVDFNNAWKTITLGDTGFYGIRFLDTGTLDKDGTLKLRARIRRDAGPASAIPEPGSLALLGLGLVGMLGLRRRRLV